VTPFVQLLTVLAIVMPVFSSGAPEPLSPMEAQVVLHRAGWEGEARREAYRVACGGGSTETGESRCIPGATNGTYLGLFQIDPAWRWLCGEDVDLFQPFENALCARKINEYGKGLGLPSWYYWHVKP